MHTTGAITQYIDVAQLALYAFWIFFACLIIYLRREDKREGYPLENDRSPNVMVQGWPKMPKPKTFLLRDGGVRVAPAPQGPKQPLNGVPTGPWLGAPLEPTGNPMLAGIGPGAYANRPDVPDRTVDGMAKIVPLRVAADYHVDGRDPDPRGLDVVGTDGAVGGRITDVWVDRSETILRYYEVEVPGGKHVLLPVNFTKIPFGRRHVKVASITGAQFADVPVLASPDQVTFLEEEKIMAYFGGGYLYATPTRGEPLV